MIKRLRIPIYEGQIVVCHSANPLAELSRAGLPTGMEDHDETSHGARAWVAERPYDEDEERDVETIGRWLVVFRPGASMNTIAHESLHLVNYLCSWFGLDNSEGNDEAAAYLMGWVFENLHEIVARAQAEK